MNQKEKSLNTKRQIACAAMQMFGTKGYEQTSLMDIAEAIHMTKGAIYHHFANKQSLLEYLTVMTQEDMLCFVKTVVEDEVLDTNQKVAKIIGYFVDGKQEQVLIQNSWVEKVPFALLDTIRVSNKELAPYFEKLIMEASIRDGVQVKWAKELSEVLVLLFDIWLDPVIFHLKEGEAVAKLEFIYEMLSKFNVSIIDETNFEKMKSLYLRGKYQK